MKLDVDHSASAFIFPFCHTKTQHAIQNEVSCLYEIWLRYYVKGLRFSRSPYAFYSIGSTIAVGAVTYAKVRGVPRRKAGEDFYLLNKIVKIAPIYELQGSPIVLSSRSKVRTPFGTAATIAKWMNKASPRKNFLFYHPLIFDFLALLHRSFHYFAHHKFISPRKAFQHIISSSHLLTEKIQQEISCQTMMELFDVSNINSLIQACCMQHPSAYSTTHLLYAIHTCFDGLKTLQLIHILQRSVFPSKPIDEVIPYACFLKQDSFRSLADLRQKLFGQDHASMRATCHCVYEFASKHIDDPYLS